MRAAPTQISTLSLDYELEAYIPSTIIGWNPVGRVVGTLTEARRLVRGFRKDYPEGTRFRIVEHKHTTGVYNV